MFSSVVKPLIISVSVSFVGIVAADEPRVPTKAPYIVLSQNLDEPNGYGFCLDTYGPGLSELMQTHTCKPKGDEDAPRNYSGHDVRFEYNAESKQVSSYAFEGQCMQVLIAKGKSEFALLDCSNHPHQQFVYDPSEMTLRLDKDTSLCVVVASTTVEAGPWVKRALTLSECSETSSELKQWLVVPAE